MKMTKEKHLELVSAWWDKRLEVDGKGDGNWGIAQFPPEEDSNPGFYRIRPQPKLRPWKPEEVPLPCILKLKNGTFLSFLSLGTNGAGIIYVDPIGLQLNTALYHIALEELQHSTDGGKTWKPCGVEGEQ